MKEIVLPSGKFARMRNITWKDFDDIFAVATDNVWLMQTRLMAQVITIDGKSVTVEELQDMAADEVLPIFNMISKKFDQINKLKNGIA